MDSIENVFERLSFDFFAKGLHKIDPGDLFDTPDSVLVDLRSPSERSILPFELPWTRTIHIPLDQLPRRFREIPPDATAGLFCSTDNRSAMAFLYLIARGYSSARILEGGYEALVKQLKPGKIRRRLPSER